MCTKESSPVALQRPRLASPLRSTARSAPSDGGECAALPLVAFGARINRHANPLKGRQNVSSRSPFGKAASCSRTGAPARSRYVVCPRYPRRLLEHLAERGFRLSISCTAVCELAVHRVRTPEDAKDAAALERISNRVRAIRPFLDQEEPIAPTHSGVVLRIGGVIVAGPPFNLDVWRTNIRDSWDALGARPFGSENDRLPLVDWVVRRSDENGLRGNDGRGCGALARRRRHGERRFARLFADNIAQDWSRMFRVPAEGPSIRERFDAWFRVSGLHGRRARDRGDRNARSLSAQSRLTSRCFIISPRAYRSSVGITNSSRRSTLRVRFRRRGCAPSAKWLRACCRKEPRSVRTHVRPSAADPAKTGRASGSRSLAGRGGCGIHVRPAKRDSRGLQPLLRTMYATAHAVSVKVIVATAHAISVAGSLCLFSTRSPTGFQLRVAPDHRSGRRAHARR